MASPKKSALVRLRWLLLVPVPLLWCVASHFGQLDFLEDKVVDWFFRTRGPMDAPVRVVYVNLDSVSLDKIGGWPWTRQYFETVARTLTEVGGVKAVGMDIVFSDAGIAESADMDRFTDGNLAFCRYLRVTPSVVVGASYTAADYVSKGNNLESRSFPDLSGPRPPPVESNDLPELPSFLLGRGRRYTPPGVGLIDTVNEETRQVRSYAPVPGRTYFAMAIELARIYYGVDRDDIRITDTYIDLRRPDGTSAARIPLYRKQIVDINWFSRWVDSDRNPSDSFSDVYNFCLALKSGDPGQRKLAETYFEQFKGAVVLIGGTDPLLHDLGPTPLDDVNVPKVGVHGNLLKTIVSGKFITHLPDAAGYFLAFALSALVTSLAVSGGSRAVFAKIMAVLSVAIFAWVAFKAFAFANLLVPVVAPVGAAFSTSAIGLLWKVVEEQKQKGRIKGMFGAYVAPALVERMVNSGEEPKLGGIEEHITAYFSDIQSFSSFSEKLSPSRLVELMNEYLTACTDIVQAEGGTLDKYIGDAVVAIYGAPLALPDHPHRACVAALQVHRRVNELRQKWINEGDRWPEIVHNLQTRIGLNTGPAVVGNMGSHTRFNYTMMGDNVNIAARMESGAKSWGVYTMCTESTRIGSESVEPGRVVFRRLGSIVVKGRTQPLPIHELSALREDATDRLRECIALFEQGLDRYLMQDWNGALDLFHKAEPLEPNGPGRIAGTHSNPSLVYIAIAEAYRRNPPAPGWDGSYEMKEK